MKESTYNKLDEQQTRICRVAGSLEDKEKSGELADIASKIQDIKSEVKGNETTEGDTE